MGRAGWTLWLAYELAGSYEEVPSTLLEEMKRHHAERRRRGDRRTRKTASLLQRGSGAGFLGFLHKSTISFREHLQARRPRASPPAFGEIRSRFLQELKNSATSKH